MFRDKGAWGRKEWGRRLAIAVTGIKKVLLALFTPITALSQVSLQILWGEAIGDRLSYGPTFRAAG